VFVLGEGGACVWQVASGNCSVWNAIAEHKGQLAYLAGVAAAWLEFTWL
jgi:hypothetical protein